MATVIRLNDPTSHDGKVVNVAGKFKGIFRQTGYEHQNSYKNEAALHSTLYCLVRIAQTMTWAPK
jgi:hypothetical protein